MDECKVKAKTSVQKAASQSQTILGDAFQLKVLFESKVAIIEQCNIEKVVVKNGHIFYQTSNIPAILKINDYGQSITPGEFYDNLLDTIKISYPKPQFLTLGKTVVKTEKTYTDFVIAEHFTKKIYFIAHDTTPGGSLYAADIGKGAEEVVAEKVELGLSGILKAITVDQLTGDVILTTHSQYDDDWMVTFQILSLQKLPYLSEWLTFAGKSNSKENVKQEA